MKIGSLIAGILTEVFQKFWLNSLSIYLCILSQPRKEDIRTGAQRHRAKKKERIKSRIGKVKRLKVMLQKRLKTVKNKCCGLGHEM